MYNFGDGTIDNPYLIQTPSQFMSIGDEGYMSSYYVLANDLDFAGIEYTPPQYFNGVIDGDFNTIANISYTTSGTQHVGIICRYAGTIQRLNFENIKMSTMDEYVNVGLLSGIMMGGCLEDCSLSGVIDAPYANTAGVSSSLNSSAKVNLITRCAIDVVLNGKEIGGVVTYATDLFATDCVFKAVINCDSSVNYQEHDGFVHTFERGEIKNCYGVIKFLTHTDSVKNRIGHVRTSWGQEGLYTNVYVDKTVSNLDWRGDSTYSEFSIVLGNDNNIYECWDMQYMAWTSYPDRDGHYSPNYAAMPISGSNYLDHWKLSTKDFFRTTDELNDPTTYKDWDFDNTWMFLEGVNYPLLRSKKVVAQRFGIVNIA